MTSLPEPSPPKVFISYAWKNQPVAKQLQRDLIRDGVEVFVDYEKITGGDSLPDRISAALDWCNTLILLWSADSAESYYVKQEWTSAFHLQKRIIACVLDGTALPALLRGRLYLNFSPYETGYVQLCHSLGVEPKIATPAPVPPSPLPPQHVEIPVGDQTSSSTGVRKSPPPATRKPESVSAKPAKKTKRWQPLVSKTTVDSLRGSAAARRVSAWWPRGKVMNITFAIIVVAMVVAVYRWCHPPQPDSAKKESAAQKPSNSDSTRDTTANLSPSKPQGQNPEVAAEQGSKTNEERKRAGKPTTPTRQSGSTLKLRNTGKILSGDSVKTMLKKYDFYCGGNETWSNPLSKGFVNDFEKQRDDKVVFDHATGLMWQQSGSPKLMSFSDTEKYIRDLNNNDFANYADWRLPTLEEAMSLMEPQKHGDLYINPVFDQLQKWIWQRTNSAPQGRGRSVSAPVFAAILVIPIDVMSAPCVRDNRSFGYLSYLGDKTEFREARIKLRTSGRRLENFLPEAKLLLPEIAVAF